ncbi:MAG TPA: methyltransferase domain-containing protein [Kofleriaceae bacterium]
MDDAAYVGTIPEHHHREIGPFLFEPYARYTAERIKALRPGRVLETACGTGIVTRWLREALPDDGLLVASDLNPPMLAMARKIVGSAARVEWTQADMCKLHFADDSFDAVICQFGLMYATDKLAAVREARRVLRPGGSFLLTTWAPLDRNPIVAVAHHALTLLLAEDPPQHLARTPFGFGDPDVLTDLLREGGFEDVVVDVVEKAASSPSAYELAAGLIEGSPLADEIRACGKACLPAVVSAVSRAIARRYGDQPVKARISALVASAVA